MNGTKQKITTGTTKKTLSKDEQDRRKRKTDAIRANIRREWRSLEAYYLKKQVVFWCSRPNRLYPPRPECPTLRLLLKKAKTDWDLRASNDPSQLKVVYRPRGGNPITVKYHKTRFSGLALTPPKSCYRARTEAGL
jgi:hypothetical protein